MLTMSSPVAYPPSSPVERQQQQQQKRAQPHQGEHDAPPPPPPPPPPSKKRVQGGFLVDDSDSESDGYGDNGAEPAAKRRMLERPGRADDIAIGSLAIDAGAQQQDAQPLFDWQSAREGGSEEQLLARTTLTETPLDVLDSIAGRHRPTAQTRLYTARTCDGHLQTLCTRSTSSAVSYERMVAARSRTKEGRATRAYYGIEIHRLIDAAKKADADAAAAAAAAAAKHTPAEVPVRSVEKGRARRTLLWTEKYRARNFVDLCGDDGTNRLVLRWLKRWDPVVFPGIARARPAVRRPPPAAGQPAEEEKPHRKILMLAGPPGLGKTTLAHVCARQAGYEVLEINASDDRSSSVVQGRIRTSLGTETVKTVANRKGGDGVQVRVARPLCVVVDEVDGVVAGAGAGGEGGFVRALIDLVLLDQKNAANAGTSSQSSAAGRKRKKQDLFRLSRPLILICNDAYHPSLRPLRQSNLAEVIHVGRPSADAVVGRLAAVFEREGIPCDKDAARKLCEVSWGLGTGLEMRRGAQTGMEGDLRSVMVMGEWVAGRYRAAPNRGPRLTRHWIEQNVLQGGGGDGGGGGAGRGLGRGSARDIVSRIFLEGGGFPKKSGGAGLAAGSSTADRVFDHEQPHAQLSFLDLERRHTMEQLRQMIETSGETDRIMGDVFAEYPTRDYNDDGFLTKPDAAYEWLHFYDACSARAYGSQEWDLVPYLSQSALACHALFASNARPAEALGGGGHWRGDGAMVVDADAPEAAPHPFTGPRAAFFAHEAEKETRAQLQSLQAQLPPSLGRAFRSADALATDLMPYLLRIVSPDVKPVVVGGSQLLTATVRREGERQMVRRAAEVLAEVGVTIERGQIESEVVGQRPEFVYRLEPDLDALCQFETAAASLLTTPAPTRYAVRQALGQELRRVVAVREAAARQARFRAGARAGEDLDAILAAASAQPAAARAPKKTAPSNRVVVKRDFFGRVIAERPRLPEEAPARNGNTSGNVVWVTYNEGLNNAVKKPISFDEFMRGF